MKRLVRLKEAIDRERYGVAMIPFELDQDTIRFMTWSTHLAAAIVVSNWIVLNWRELHSKRLMRFAGGLAAHMYLFALHQFWYAQSSRAFMEWRACEQKHQTGECANYLNLHDWFIQNLWFPTFLQLVLILAVLWIVSPYLDAMFGKRFWWLGGIILGVALYGTAQAVF